MYSLTAIGDVMASWNKECEVLSKGRGYEGKGLEGTGSVYAGKLEALAPCRCKSNPEITTVQSPQQKANPSAVYL